MSKINTLLKISNNADESEQESEIQNLQKDLEAKTTELEEVKNTLKTLQDEKAAKDLEAKTALKTKAETLVNKAADEKKIKPEEKVDLINAASASQSGFDLVSNMLDKIPGGKKAAHVFNAANVSDTKSTEKTYEELEVENPDTLVELYQNNKPEFERLYNASKYAK